MTKDYTDTISLLRLFRHEAKFKVLQGHTSKFKVFQGLENGTFKFKVFQGFQGRVGTLDLIILID